jgi:hypothetical protein
MKSLVIVLALTMMAAAQSNKPFNPSAPAGWVVNRDVAGTTAYRQDGSVSMRSYPGTFGRTEIRVEGTTATGPVYQRNYSDVGGRTTIFGQGKGQIEVKTYPGTFGNITIKTK